MTQIIQENPPPALSAICFPGETPVHTDQGVINIGKVCPGKHTIRNNEIEMVTETIGLEDFLICIKKDALFPNVPSMDTYTTSEHKFYVNKQNISAGMLEHIARKSGNEKYMNNIYKVPYEGQKLYNVMLKDKHDYMRVNNLIAETLHPENEFVKHYIGLKNKTCSSSEKSIIVKEYNKYISKVKNVIKYNASIAHKV